MLFNNTFGFVLPWLILGTYLYKLDKKIIFFIVPFSASIAYTVDELGFYFNFWSLTPTKYESISSLTTDLGYFALIGGMLIAAIKKSVLNDYLIVLVFSIITTMVEGVFVLTGRIIYGNGWNVFWTFYSYLIPYGLVYYFYLALKKQAYME